MKEIFEFRIDLKYSHLLFDPNEGKNIGDSVKIITLTKDDPRFTKIPIISKRISEESDYAFFYGWRIKRKYSEKELKEAKLFSFKITKTFEPAGEEYGTKYDESVACYICGANRKQIGQLKLKKGSIPKKDIARTIAGEVLVSEKFVTAFKQYGLKRVNFEQVYFGENLSSYYQPIITSPELGVSNKTIAGVNPF